MHFEKYLLEQIHKHPSVQPQDLVKLCYQAAFGAEHLLSDLDGARNYLERELAAVEAREGELCENISNSVCRVDLGAWKGTGLPAEWLFQMFAASAAVSGSGQDLFSEYLTIAGKTVQGQQVQFLLRDWHSYLERYRAAGIGPVHHSACYRQQEKPSYRIIDRQYARLLPVLELAASAAKKIPKDRVCVIAIDGRAAAGKSTAAGQLKRILGAEVVHMDDFFLPPKLRSRERFAQPGGNVHYERFLEEVWPYLARPQSFSYRVFDCSKMDYAGERGVGSADFRIVEGSYSCHPQFGPYADVTVFLDVEPEEQMHRILCRDGSEMAEMFRHNWIPLEEKYFETFGILQKADAVLG